MTISSLSAEQIRAKTIAALTGTPFSNLAPGSRTKMILDAVGAVVADTAQLLDFAQQRTLFPNASGQVLDMYGELLGTPRIQAQRLQVLARDRTFRFSVASTFGALGLTSIPQGTLISSTQDFTSGVFVIPQTIALPAGASEVFVSAESVIAGVDAQARVRFHNLNPALTITQLISLPQATQQETDDAYRARLSKVVLGSPTGNPTSLQQAALAVPGVADVVVLPRHRGVGSVDVIVKAISPQISDNILYAVELACQEVLAAGMSLRVAAPDLVGLEFALEITWTPDATSARRAQAKQQISQQLSQYVNGLDIAQAFIASEAAAVVQQASGFILSSSIVTVNVYRDNSEGDRAPLQQSLQDIPAAALERIVMETGTTVTITDRN